ncbi:hypothetical protein CNMCM6805_010448 [Aspergillus fumigatiaffinis]|uniref:Major facilitator superfamily (MFS) profile domain-containing protein n=1 Tax=Aspergillus fumigatiaffinis TaxID=340414 RepID=A0A8H4ME64_9EURO|nr:hypothetical protein CNMCM6805_010448 [Aspergillus fumigatiaffinis]
MIEDRLHLDPSKAQGFTSAALSIHALVCFASGPVIGHLADKVSSRKGPLLLSVVEEIVGTILVAAAPSVFFLGRVVQAFAGNAAWIIGFATIADTVEAENRSRTISTISVFFISGMLFGPMMSGSLIGLIGYWPTWLAAIAVLIVDALMLFLMVETRKSQRKDVESASRAGTGTGTGSPDETSSLLSGPPPAQREPEQSPQQNGSIKPAAESFYKIILSNPRALTSMVCHATISLTLACFDTTLPLHVSRAFGWGPFQTSLMFLLLQVPALLLSPLTGWMKDRWGTKIPSGIGFLAHAPLLWLLGAAGREGLPLVGSEQRGKTIYTITIVSLGIVRTLVTGCGTIEMTNVVTELQEKQPAIFGPNGGYSRAFSLTNMSWTFSMFIGPILSGALTETVGYYYMNICLATICAGCGALALSDESGAVRFRFIFPGHYTGRATHIHVLTHNANNTTELANGTISGLLSTHPSHIGRLLFDQDLISQVESLSLYTTNTQKLTTNANGDILAGEAADIDPFMKHVLLGEDVSDGIFTWISVAIDPTADRELSPAAYYTSGGGFENANSAMSGGPGGSSPSGAALSGTGAPMRM